MHSEKYSNKAVQTDNSRAVRLVVSLSLNFTTRQTARELRLTAALDEIYPERRVYIDSVSSIALELYVSRIIEL